MTNDKKNTDFIVRLKLMIKNCGDKKKVFAEKCGIAETNLYTYLRGASLPAMPFFVAMKNQYPWVNIDWLITGQGDPTTGVDERDGPENVIDIQHNEIIKDFKDKPRAKDANISLLAIESLDRDAFVEMVGFIKGTASNLMASKKEGMGEHEPAATKKKQVNG